MVARDEHERGDRALLNLGHTFGHALERLTHYDGARLIHGEAVAIGVALAFRFSAAQGLCPLLGRRPGRGSFPRRRPADPHRRHSGLGRRAPTPFSMP